MLKTHGLGNGSVGRHRDEVMQVEEKRSEVDLSLCDGRQFRIDDWSKRNSSGFSAPFPSRAYPQYQQFPGVTFVIHAFFHLLLIGAVCIISWSCRLH